MREPFDEVKPMRPLLPDGNGGEPSPRSWLKRLTRIVRAAVHAPRLKAGGLRSALQAPVDQP